MSKNKRLSNDGFHETNEWKRRQEEGKKVNSFLREHNLNESFSYSYDDILPTPIIIITSISKTLKNEFTGS